MVRSKSVAIARCLSRSFLLPSGTQPTYVLHARFAMHVVIRCQLLQLTFMLINLIRGTCVSSEFFFLLASRNICCLFLLFVGPGRAWFVFSWPSRSSELAPHALGIPSVSNGILSSSSGDADHRASCAAIGIGALGEEGHHQRIVPVARETSA